MILFKGQHSIKHYNPIKPIKRGYKLWVRADMDGYISKFDVYQGKAAEESTVEDLNGSTFGLGEQVVQTMTQDLAGKNHEVHFDYFVYFDGVPKRKWNQCGWYSSDEP